MLHYDDSSRDDWAVAWFSDPQCTNGVTLATPATTRRPSGRRSDRGPIIDIPSVRLAVYESIEAKERDHAVR